MPPKAKPVSPTLVKWLVNNTWANTTAWQDVPPDRSYEYAVLFGWSDGTVTWQDDTK